MCRNHSPATVTPTIVMRQHAAQPREATKRDGTDLAAAEDGARRLIEARDRAIEMAPSSKQSYVVTDQLDRYFRALDEAERVQVEPLLAEWLLSDDASERWDALRLVDHFAIAAMRPTLLDLDMKLARIPGPGAVFERERVARALADLSR